MGSKQWTSPVVTFVAVCVMAVLVAVSAPLALGSGVSASAATLAPSVAPQLAWIQWSAPGSYNGRATIPEGADPVYPYAYATEALGTIAMPGGATVYVKLTGEILGNMPTQPPAPLNASGFGIASNSYWSARNGAGTNGAAFRSANVPDLPSNGDRIGVAGSSAGGVQLQTLQFFSDAGRTTSVAVSNLVMDVWSLGRPGAGGEGRWNFTQNFDILSDNRNVPGFSGFTKGAGGPPYSLSATEGTGTIQFAGSYTSVAWTVVYPELYAVWNIGVTSATAPSDVPYPITYDDNGATTPSSGGAATYLNGVVFTLPKPPTRTGYTFAGWKVTGAVMPTSLSADATTATLAGLGAVTLTAEWTADPVPAEPTTTIAPTDPIVPTFTG